MSEVRTGTRGFGHGSFRTLCVRSCDGYYWPISHATLSSRFARDEQSCAASCPNQDVGLYVHRTEGQWSDEARSLRGEPLTGMGNAFLYRREYRSSCRCKPPMTEIARGNDEPASATPIPAAFRSTLSAFADSDRTGTTDAKPEAGPAEAEGAEAAHPGPSRTVRTVGPSFFPDR